MSILPQNNDNRLSNKRLVACFFAALGFGLVYDQISSLVLRQPWAEKKSSIAVAIGVAVTVLISAPLIGWRAVKQLALIFGASGVPMVAGQFMRHARNLARAKQRARQRGFLVE